MTTQKQRTANRRNAKKSTGPRTVKGRARSSINALKHGLTAAQIIVADEKSEDLENFHNGLIDVLMPVGGLEEQLVERIAVCAWRLRRIYRIEARLLAEPGSHLPTIDFSKLTFKELDILNDLSTAIINDTLRDRPTRPASPAETLRETDGTASVSPTPPVGRTGSAAEPFGTASVPSNTGGAPREAARNPSIAAPDESANTPSDDATSGDAKDIAALFPETIFDIGAVFRTLAVSQGPLFQLSRHETTIERSLHRALHDLERLQARRKGEAVMAPVALDI
jgi:hypothetical protein